jgi:hypothetical protein
MQLHTNNQLSVESLTAITQYYLISLNIDTPIKNASKKTRKNGSIKSITAKLSHYQKKKTQIPKKRPKTRKE